MVNVKKTDPIRHFSSKKDTSIKINCDTVPMSGDIQISVLDRDPLYAETMFSISLHLSFLEEFHTIIPGEPETEVEESDQDEFVVITPTESRLGAISSRYFLLFLSVSSFLLSDLHPFFFFFFFFFQVLGCVHKERAGH